ncbi:MAG: transglycosylase SLT domain-containing protein, partial [Chloroflexi bacterium]|nr:transglycosylase SLT domain-containing protein [Chloroflexota bacterium]
GLAATDLAGQATTSQGSGAPSGESFDAVLGRFLATPQSDIAAIRSEIASVRSGAPLFARTAVPTLDLGRPPGGLTNVPGWLDAQLASQVTGDTADPYGWRASSRHIAERVIGPGYGALFERQMQQESGFTPEVVYGLRVSSAGAEGIAQLMPQYYPHVARTDPVAGLQAGAETMRHYLDVWDGDVRKALASYNAGLGRVQSLVQAHGANWEAGLPQETRSYLAAILGAAAPSFVRGAGSAAGVDAVGGATGGVFGGRGPGGVLTAPLSGTGATVDGTSLRYLGDSGATVRSPSDGVVVEASAGRVTIDHGNGWRSTMSGVDAAVGTGTHVRRSDPIGGVDAGGVLDLGVLVDGRAVNARTYVFGTH